ncbi:MAG: PQQ-binding-like beta-propeller repeat protein [Planctomycetaceae bacterium]|nr:PQQ-binding-like beta-propeller repeat protein [Planctomycetaceae bacterium]
MQGSSFGFQSSCSGLRSAALLAVGLLAGLCLPGGLQQQARGGDWPQILGPHRNGVAAADERLLTDWPADGPQVLWKKDVGSGFSGVAVAGETAVLFHRVENEEVVEAYDAATGKVLWTHRAPTSFSTGFSPDNGPRCVPLIHKGSVVLYGAQGRLTSLDLTSGKESWKRETHQEFGAREGYFGAGSTPVIAGGLVLVNVGGDREGAGVVAFDPTDGRTVWKATDEAASYSSPAVVEVDGVQQAVFVTRLKTVGLNPKNGEILWEFPFGKRGPTVNAATPQIVDGNVFVTAHYGVGAVLARPAKNSVEVVWASDAIMSSQYMTSVPSGSALFGIDGQERVDTPVLKCFDPRTRNVYWAEEDFGFGSLLRAGDQVLALLTDGTLVQFQATAKKYTELNRARVLTTTTRALPALANGRLFVRDTKTLLCLQVGRNGGE